jgi:hypothetical protein
MECEECTFQQHKNDPNKMMKPAEEEWNQSDLRLANYAQNGVGTEKVQRTCPVMVPGLSGPARKPPKIQIFIFKFDS